MCQYFLTVSGKAYYDDKGKKKTCLGELSCVLFAFFFFLCDLQGKKAWSLWRVDWTKVEPTICTFIGLDPIFPWWSLPVGTKANLINLRSKFCSRSWC